MKHQSPHVLIIGLLIFSFVFVVLLFHLQLSYLILGSFSIMILTSQVVIPDLGLFLIMIPKTLSLLERHHIHDGLREFHWGRDILLLGTQPYLTPISSETAQKCLCMKHQSLHVLFCTMNSTFTVLFCTMNSTFTKQERDSLPRWCVSVYFFLVLFCFAPLFFFFSLLFLLCFMLTIIHCFHFFFG